jgi:Carboxypeptidase regulatory-like domain/TonB-dependent Receptor Plug Domain
VRRNVYFGLVFLWAFAVIPSAYGQTTTGTILGTVSDSTGARVPDTAIAVTNELTGEHRTTTTNSAGDYLFLALPVGKYRVEATKQSFSAAVRSGVTLDVNQNARVDFEMKVGQVSEQVVITGGAPLVDTHEVQLGGVVDTKRVSDLPLNGRNVYSLVSLLPGVSGTSLPSDPDASEGAQVNVNGARVLQTTFLLDGGLNQGQFRSGGLLSPNPDSVEEFRLLTSNYNAEYGRSGGGIVTVVTKSGTNQLHGTLYEYLRNDALDSRSFFQPGVSMLRQNQFGGNVSGPVKHDKLFFFFSYQGLRNRAGQFQSAARTPTAAMRAGDFSAVPANQRPKDPDAAGNPLFPGGLIPISRLDPVALAAMKYIALPNTPDGRVLASSSASDNNDQYFGKGDYLINSAHRLSVTSFFVRSTALYPFTNSNQITNIPDYDPERWKIDQNNVVMNEVWSMRPTLLNQFTFGYTRVPTDKKALNTFGWSTWGSKYVVGALPEVPPRFVVTGGWQGGSQGNTVELDQSFQFSDSISWIRGGHSIKFGASLAKQVFDFDGTSRSSGNIMSGAAFTGNAFSDFLMGRMASFDGSNAFTPHLHQWQIGEFIQDDWKISRRVTLNLGLRHEIFTPWKDANGGLQQYAPGQQSKRFPSAPLGMVFPGDPGVPDGLLRTDWHDFGPRIGVAFDPFGDGKMAIRAGYGIFYSFGFAGLFNSNVAQPFQIDVTAFGTPSLVDPFKNAGGNPFPAAPGKFVLPVTVSWMDQNNRVPYVQQYSLVVERQLARNFSFNAGYVGNVSRHLQEQRDANQAIFIPGQSTAANVAQRRPIMPGIFNNISQALTGANSSYNSLQATLNRRFARGFTLLANYTYSKTIDTQSSDQQSVGALTFVDSTNMGLDRSVSGLDLRHLFNLSFVYQTPALTHWGFAGKYLLGGWQVNGIARFTSGRPFNVTSGVDSNVNGNNNDRPNLIGDPHLDTSRSKDQKLAQYFNPKAFGPVVTGQNGNVGRNILYGLGARTWDMSFFRDFPIHERHKLQFRAELFNIFNHANFANPVAVISNPNAGQILNAGAGRVIQFGLKYSF